MSDEEFARQYGASQEDIDQVTAFATSHNLQVLETNAARRTVVVQGTVAQMNAAFGVDLGRYEHQVQLRRGGEPQTETYRGRDGFIYIPNSLRSIVLGVFGLDNRRVGQHNGPEPPNTTTLSVPTVSKLYNYPTNSASGQTIGIFSLTGYAIGDITSYFAGLPAGYTAPTVTDILINGATNPGSDPVGETTQDIDIAASFAPGAAVNVYITTADQQGWVQAIGRVAHPNASDRPCSVLSSSWFIADGDDTAGLARRGVTVAFVNAVTAAFQDAAIQGVTVCIASGDRGTDSGMGDGKAHVQYPASDPWVLSVGGTTIGNVHGQSFDEYVWNDPGADPNQSNWGTTGGGVSDFFPVPGYQANAGVPPSVNDSSHHGRGVPDVAGNANIASGYSGIILGGNPALYPGNGTSASAPQWAGLIAVINAALGVNVGFVNPAIYALGSSVFRDIVPGAGPGDNSNSGVPGYPAGPGWDACTGWGSPNGEALLAGLRSIYTRNLYFIVDKSTFGLDEVSDVVTNAGGLYSSAFWLVLEGFSIHQLGSLTPTLSGPFHGLTGVTVFMDAAGPSYESPGDLYTPQRIRFPYDIIFSSQAVSSDFPAVGSGPDEELLNASITLGGTTLAAEAVFELVAGADPYFTNIDPVTRQVFYLSQDLRVFSAAAGDTPLPGAPAVTSDPYGSIQALLGFLNSNTTYTTPGPDPLNALPSQTGYETGDSSVTPLNGSGSRNYNFAIARVRLQGAANSSAPNVRVFFRLWVAQSCDTDFQPATTYQSQLGTGGEAGLPVFPLPSGSGLVDPSGQSIQTVPFFATDANGTHDYDGSNANANIRTVQIPAAQDKTWAYFGCFLDVYNSANQSIFPGTHHCIVTQIAYDDAPIQNYGGVTLSPENTDKLAQRNLQITSSGNPGYPDTHRIPQAFDTRASASAGGATGQLQDYPDELMIDWGNVPAGSVATIYWPQVEVQDVVSLASKLYGAHSLEATDAHTIRFTTTKGVTYVPIPFADGTKFAGLVTVDLPNTIHAGQELKARVRRITSRRLSQLREGGVNAAAVAGKRSVMRNWRYVTGTFQITIPVEDDKKLLRSEENTLAILKWRLERYSPTYRWRPVLRRYIDYISARVDGFGGNAGAVKPSPTGLPQRDREGGRGEERLACTGKISAIVFDRFGDFEGFDLDTEDGQRRFVATERPIEDLVRQAWIERILITVWAERHEPHHPASIVFRRAPRRFDD